MDTERDWKGILAIIVVILGLCIAAWYGFTHRNSSDASTTSSETGGNVINAVFNCDSGRSVRAAFDNNANTVRLILSDGRELTLPHALSADGARYANADESFVFWNKGNGAFIEELGTTTYSGCVTNS